VRSSRFYGRSLRLPGGSGNVCCLRGVSPHLDRGGVTVVVALLVFGVLALFAFAVFGTADVVEVALAVFL
jgi:hypothetical protein